MAALMLAALVVGMPVALWALDRSLRLADGFAPSRLGTALTRPDDGSLFLLALLLIAWIGWAVFTLSVVVEVVALARGIPTPHLPLLKVPQQGAAALVATAALLVTPAVTTSHALLARPVAAVAALDLTDRPAFQAPTPRSAEPSAPPAGVDSRRALPPQPTVTVRRHDTLWSLAEKHLGSGERFRELVDLNRGRPQADGRVLKDAGWIYPGWVLRLPADARLRAETPAVDRTPASGSDGTYVVERGDSLWRIADDGLGEGERYGEIYDLNEGRSQPDGMRLSDPDEIRPDWRLRLPGQPAAAPRGRPAAEPRENSGIPDRPPAPRPPPSPRTSPAGAATAGVPTPTPQPAERSATADSSEHGRSLAPTLVLGLGTMLLTGLVAELTRRRRLQQRSRRTGQRIAMPAGAPEAAEQQARAAADTVTVESLNVALRVLATSCRDAGRPLPDVVVVRVTQAAIELLLLADDADPAPPFEASSARTWRLEAMPSRPPDEDVADPYPGLVGIGVDDDALVLLNLEAVGSMTLVGPREVTDPVLRALAMDLAVGPLAEGRTLTLAGCFADLAQVVGPARARFLADGPVAARECEVRTNAIRRALDSSRVAGIREARASGVASDASGPEILLAVEELPIAPRPWSGVAAVIMGWKPFEDGGCTLRVRADGSARLDPPGIEISPQNLTQDSYDDLVTLLATAGAPTEPEPTDQPLTKPAGRDVGDDRNATLEALHESPEEASPSASEAVPPRVLLLGTVRVEGADDGAAPGRRRRATELVAYLALHGGATTHQVDEALWPGRRVAKNTRNPFVSRVRQWLGRTPDGEAYLPLVADDGAYRLRPELTCDWHDFLCLARRGLAQGPDGLDDLAAALHLVRGRPFLGIDPATYAWAEADVQEMISAIVDVAHVLSATLCEAGDHRGAQEAAAKGLLVEPCSELLYRDAIRAAAARGDRQEVERLAARLRDELALIDPEDGVDVETADLLAAVKGG